MGKEVKKKKKDEVLEEEEVKKKSKKKKFKIEKQKEKKKSKVNKKLLTIVAILVIGLVVGGIFLVSSLREIKKTKLAESEPIISTLDDGTYYMVGASLDESFEVEVEDEFSYEVLDQDEKKVKVIEEKNEGKVILKPTEDGWDEGATYTLKIINGKFTDSELSDANVVTFSTVRVASQSHKYTKNVDVVSSDKVKITDNIVKTSKKLKVGEIIVVEDNEGEPSAAYRIVKVNDNGTYETEVPTLEEVFSKFDYYNMEYLDLSEIEVNEELAAYLGSVAKKSIIDSLMLDADAAAKVKVSYPKYNKKSKEVVFGVTLETDPGDKVFNKSFLKHHKLSTGYEVGIKVKAYENFYSAVRWDVGVEFEIRQSINTGIKTESETLDKIKNNFSEFAADKTGVNWLSDELYKIEKDDYGLDKKFGEVSVESGIPGIQIVLTTNLLLDFDVKGNISSNLTNTTKASFGYSTEKEFYATASTKNKMTAEAMAEGKVRIGITAKAGVEVLNMVNLLGTGSVGLYGKGNISAKSEMTTDKMTNTVDAKLEAGTFAEIGAEANLFGKKLTFKGWSKEWPKVTKTIPFKNETVVKIEQASKEETKKDETTTPAPSAPAEVYYNVALYDLVVCSNAGFRNIANIKVKAGDTLYNALVAGVKENYIAEWNEYSYDNTYGVIWCDKVNGQTICEGRDDGLHYYDSSVPSQVAAYNNLYAQRNQCNAACGEEDWDCMTNCDNLYPYDNRPTVNTGLFNINTPINSNMSLIGYSLVGGCGSAGPEDEE